MTKAGLGAAWSETVADDVASETCDEVVPEGACATEAGGDWREVVEPWPSDGP